MKASPYFKQAQLVLRVLPLIHTDKRFALKGGTALNFFVLEMPRLSVDIDLTFLPITPREAALKDISDALEAMAVSIERAIPDSRIDRIGLNEKNRISKLSVRTKDALIKIEPNEVIRGTVFPCDERTLVKQAEDLFEMSVSVNALSLADLYGGKLCAALDRQHPRDLFDIKLLMEGTGITDDIRKAFVIYLASHNRPINEVLNPRPQDFQHVFEHEFKGIAAIDISYEDLKALQNALPDKIRSSLTADEKRFLLSVKTGEPEWKLLRIEGVDHLPALRWKVQNIKRMSGKKHKTELEKLRAILKI